MWRLRTKQGGGVGIVAPDHVAVDHGNDLPDGNHRMRGVPARPEQPTLLGAVVDEEHGAPGGLLR